MSVIVANVGGDVGLGGGAACCGCWWVGATAGAAASVAWEHGGSIATRGSGTHR